MNNGFQKQKTFCENNRKDETNDINEEIINKKLSIKKSKLLSLLENNIKSFSSKNQNFDNISLFI